MNQFDRNKVIFDPEDERAKALNGNEVFFAWEAARFVAMHAAYETSRHTQVAHLIEMLEESA